ncbi:hypothetical protein [Nocardia mangyaensis]|uniref:hypothetical protein n=1 Tax=Nocardia mangyaensis TaxID=2213200 RepID=UPI002676C80C|nr:hypothetical protein [Nocardia mangyaensis]MDO3647230.1 hypothetical protein [Nocardia mangyaensis]
MGYSNTLGVQTGELGQLGNDLKISGATVANTVKRITDNAFGAGDAGREYAQEGKSIAAGLEIAIAWLNNWSSATTAIGDGVGASSLAYSNTDTENAKNTSKAGENV